MLLSMLMLEVLSSQRAILGESTTLQECAADISGTTVLLKEEMAMTLLSMSPVFHRATAKSQQWEIHGWEQHNGT